MSIPFDLVTSARALHVGAMTLLWGVLLFRACVAWPRGGRRAILRLSWAALVVAFLSGVGWLVALAEIDGNHDSLRALALETHFGRVMVAREWLILGLAGALPRLVAPAAGVMDYFFLALAAAALGSLALTGHAGASGALESACDALHLLAACGWVGALAPFVVMLRHGDAAAMARRFSSLGVICVIAMSGGGAVNALSLGGGLPGVLGTDWGRLLCVKLALIAVMLAFAAFNRTVITPRLARSARASATLRITAFAELALGVAVMTIAAALGSIPPGAHETPEWPLAWRLDASAFESGAENAAAAWRAVFAGVIAAALGLAAMVWRRPRWQLAGAALVALAMAIATAPTLTTAAWPTSFQTSPTSFSASAIALGAGAFANHCAQCHGERGAGDGRLAAELQPKPADLTQDHLFTHLDGDLYWWISYGLGSMPAFAAALDPSTLWGLVDFLHANADGLRLRSLNGRVAGAAFPLPEFALSCPGSEAATSADLVGAPLHIVIADPSIEPRLRQLSFLAASVETRVIILPAGDVKIPTGDWKPCVAEEEALFAALAVYNFTGAERLAGLEFLVDARGRLRSMWNAQSSTDWRDPLAFRRALAEMKVPQDLARALSAVNAAPGATGARFETDGHRH